MEGKNPCQKNRIGGSPDKNEVGKGDLERLLVRMKEVLGKEIGKMGEKYSRGKWW